MSDVSNISVLVLYLLSTAKFAISQIDTSGGSPGSSATTSVRPEQTTGVVPSAITPAAGANSNESFAASSGGGSQSSSGGSASSSGSSSSGGGSSDSSSGGSSADTGQSSTPGVQPTAGSSSSAQPRDGNLGSSTPPNAQASTPSNGGPAPLDGLPLPVQFGEADPEAGPCPEQESQFGFPWPETPAGDALYVDCPDGYEGQIGRYCDPSGSWSQVVDNCVSEELKQVDNLLADGPQGIGPALDVVDRLKNSLSPDGILYGGELKAARRAARRLCDWDPLGFQDTGKEEAADFVWLFIGTVSRLLQKNNKDVWDNIRNADQVNVTLTPLPAQTDDDDDDVTNLDPVIDLILLTEEFGGKVARFLNSSAMELFETNETSIDFQAKKVDIPNFAGFYYPPSANGGGFISCSEASTNDTASFHLPRSALETGYGQQAEVVNIVFRDAAFLLEGENQTSVFSNGTVRSVVLSSTVYPEIEKSFSDPIKIKFTHDEILTETHSRQCAFVNNGGKATEGSEWGTEGCEVDQSTATCTICSCNHLTSFAILMQPVALDLTEEQEGALWYITLVGSSVSLLSLATTIFLLLFFGCWKSERSFLLMNLVLALMAAQVTFLAGINATSNRTTCRAVAILVHYFFLASFFWMMAHGIQLFFKVKSVFSATRDRRLEFFLFGWINPGAIVIVTSGVNPNGYETEKYCWLSTDNGMVYAFIGPVLFIVAVNFCILFFVIKTFMSIKANCKKSDIQKTKAGIRACAVLMPLLGITWLVGVVAVDQSTVPFQYIFAAVNSAQGLFIFIFHGLQNEDVKESFRRYRSRSKVSSLRTDSSNSGLNARLIGKNNLTNLTTVPSPKTQHVGVK